ncbi:MAG: type II secretion system GspH family protein [Puniceicoccales bacterium]|jgi:prepilin-type N-terminal cleavage/methylation domain-containing protein|nr:type II secretion system GspH family protein [Puniceicoccales bacterium]
MNSTKNKSAFSLIEILIVIALMALFAGMSALGFRKIDEKKFGPKEALQKAVRIGKYIARKDKKDMYLIIVNTKNKTNDYKFVKEVIVNSKPVVSDDSSNVLGAIRKDLVKKYQQPIPDVCFVIGERLMITGNDDNPTNEYGYILKKMYLDNEEVEKVEIIDKRGYNNFGFRLKSTQDKIKTVKIGKNGILQEFYLKCSGAAKDAILNVNPISGEVTGDMP